MTQEQPPAASAQDSRSRKTLGAFADQFFRVDPATEPQLAEERRMALQRLSKQRRRIVRLHYFERTNFAEIGEQLAIPAEQVEASWYDALAELRDTSAGHDRAKLEREKLDP